MVGTYSKELTPALCVESLLQSSLVRLYLSGAGPLAVGETGCLTHLLCVCVGGGHSKLSVSHVVGSQEPDEAIVWFGRLSQVVRYQLIGWVKHLV